ncbi:glutathione S-transferase family protein [Alphaproteobacteria bacterium LSUCC0684]
MKPFRVYGISGAGSLIAEYLLALAGAEYELICLEKEERDGEAFRRISPTGQIPALVTPEGDAFCESLAITLYLLERFPETGMIAPGGNPDRLQCLQWLSFLSSSLYNANLRYYYPDRFGPEDGVRPVAQADRRTIYDLIEARKEPYLAGEKMSAADLYLYMLLFWDETLADELASRPRIRRIIADVGALPAVRDVMARQP